MSNTENYIQKNVCTIINDLINIRLQISALNGE